MTTTDSLAGTWSLDPSNSTVSVTARNFFVRSVPATFKLVAADAHVGPSPAASTLKFALAAQSFDSGNPKRDKHVRSSDFLDADTHPTITFASRHISETESGFRVQGALEIAGTSTDIEFDITDISQTSDEATFEAAGSVDRRRIGVAKMPSFVIGNEIDIRMSGHVTR